MEVGEERKWGAVMVWAMVVVNRDEGRDFDGGRPETGGFVFRHCLNRWC